MVRTESTTKMTNDTNNTSSIISKVWSFMTILRDAGVGYGDYLEQLTYLLFLKMADEFSRPPYNRQLPIPTEYNWESLACWRTPLQSPLLLVAYELLSLRLFEFDSVIRPVLEPPIALDFVTDGVPQ